MERVFELMLCTEEQKLRIAAYMLEGRGLEWWTSIRNRQQPGVELRWEDFKREYNLQFYPSVYRDQKRREFLALTQGSLSVMEYEAAFTALSRYATILVADEGEKCRLFQDGLNLQIKARTRMHHIGNYPELEHAALEAEEIEKDFATRRQERGKKSAFGSIPDASWFQRGKKPQQLRQISYDRRTAGETSSGSGSISVTGPYLEEPIQGIPPAVSSRTEGGAGGLSRSYSMGGTIPGCANCGRIHHGECRLGAQGCYHYGQMGHMQFNCPLRGQSQGQGCLENHNTEEENVELQDLPAREASTSHDPQPGPLP